MGETTYYINVIRPPSSVSLSALRVLSSLSKELVMVPPFNPAHYLYTAASNDTSLKAYVVVDATPSGTSAAATVAIHGVTVPSSHAPLDMTSCGPLISSTELDVVCPCPPVTHCALLRSLMTLVIILVLPLS